MRELLVKESNQIFYSVASVWEVAIKHIIKPENMPVSEEEFVWLCEETGFTKLPIAQAKYEDLILLTHDSQFPYYGEKCVMHV